MKGSNRVLFGKIIKIIQIASVIYGLIFYLLDDGAITLTKFTTISNVMVTVFVLLSLIYDCLILDKPDIILGLKYIFTVAVIITFMIYLTILAPTNEYGFINSYFRNYGASFALHVVSPVLCIVDMIFLDVNYVPSKIYGILSISISLCYVLFVVILAYVFGIRWDYGMMAPYNFLNYGAPTGWFGFEINYAGNDSLGIGVFYNIAVLVLIFALFEQFLRRILKKIHKN